MLKHAVRALFEVKTFLHCMEEDRWPFELRSLQRNLLCTNIFDEDLIENSGNDGFILQSLLEIFQRHYPIEAKQLGGKREQRDYVGESSCGTVAFASDFHFHDKTADGTSHLSSEYSKIIQDCW